MKTHVLRFSLAAVLAIAVLAATPLFAASLSVTPAASFNGTNFGMQVDFPGDTANAFVQDDSPACETVYSAEFFLRNQLTMTDGDTHQIFRARQPGDTVIRMQVKKAQNGSGNFVTFVWARTNAGGYTAPIQTFTNNQHKMRVEWQAGAGTGFLRLYKGDNLRGEITSISNDNYCVENVQLGAFGGVDAATSGQFHFDEFVSLRTTE